MPFVGGIVGSQGGESMVTSPFGDIDELLLALKSLPDDNYGNAIAKLRESKGYTQEKLESKLSFSLRTLQRLENSEFPVPDINKLMELCVVLELKFDIALHLFKLSGLSEFLFRKTKQSLIYRKILEFEGDYTINDINKMLVEVEMLPLLLNNVV